MADGPAVQSFGSVDIPDEAFDDTPEPVVETPAVEAPAAPAVDAPAAEAPPADDKFDRSYVEQLRNESAGYRTKAKTYTDAFDGIEESDRDVFLGLANLYKTDPIAAGKEMARLAQGLVGDDSPADAPAAKPFTEGYMTEARYNEIKQQERLAADTDKLIADARALGYDPATPEYSYLLAVARTKEGNLNSAHEYIQTRERDAVGRFVAAKTAEAEGAHTAPGEVGAPASGERRLTSYRDVEDAIDELW